KPPPARYRPGARSVRPRRCPAVVSQTNLERETTPQLAAQPPIRLRTGPRPTPSPATGLASNRDASSSRENAPSLPNPPTRDSPRAYATSQIFAPNPGRRQTADAVLVSRNSLPHCAAAEP